MVAFHQFGGAQGFAEALDTDLDKGTSGDEKDLCRRRITLEKDSATRGFLHFLLHAGKNWVIFLLLLSAGLSVGFGMKERGQGTGWYEGFFIIIAILMLVTTRAMQDFWNESLKMSLEKQKLSERVNVKVHVLRGGHEHRIPISDIVFGDVVCLKRGCEIPGDGLFISGSVKLDDGTEYGISIQNQFLLYGTTVINGNGRMLVTSVGNETEWAEAMRLVAHDSNEKTPLQAQLDRVYTWTQIIALLVSITILVISFLRYTLGKIYDGTQGSDFKDRPKTVRDFMDAILCLTVKPKGRISILTTALTVFVVGLQEGLPFVVTLFIAHIKKKAASNRAIMQELLACISMGSLTTICADNVGGLMLNQMEVDVFRTAEAILKEVSGLAPNVVEPLCNGIGIPVLLFETPRSIVGDPFVQWARTKLDMRMEILEQSCTVVETKKLNEESCGVLMKKKNQEGGTNLYLHWKGPAPRILIMCSHYYDEKGSKKVMDKESRESFNRFIKDMQAEYPQTIAFAYKNAEVEELDEENLILIGLFGLKSRPLEEKIKAITDFRNAGVCFKLVSGDNTQTLKAIAEDYQLLPPGSDDQVLTGSEFRNLTDEERTNKVDRITVMGDALPLDKLNFVKCLRQNGHVVGVIEVHTKQTPTLKEADVGITTGSFSTEIVRETSAIIITNATVNFLLDLIIYGRSAFENIQKFIQVELTMNVAALLINIIMTVRYGDSPITTIQLFWANIIVAFLGGVALLTEPPTRKMLEKPPQARSDPLITKPMWRNLVTQALYQVAILVTFQFKGETIPGVKKKAIKTMIFNSFILCQVYHQFSARDLEKINVFKGIHKNHWFWVAVGLEIGLQVAVIVISRFVFGGVWLDCKQWVVCVLIGLGSMVIDWVAKLVSSFSIKCFTGVGSPDPGCKLAPSPSVKVVSNLELPLMCYDGGSEVIQS